MYRSLVCLRLRIALFRIALGRLLVVNGEAFHDASVPVRQRERRVLCAAARDGVQRQREARDLHDIGAVEDSLEPLGRGPGRTGDLQDIVRHIVHGVWPRAPLSRERHLDILLQGGRQLAAVRAEGAAPRGRLRRRLQALCHGTPELPEHRLGGHPAGRLLLGLAGLRACRGRRSNELPLHQLRGFRPRERHLRRWQAAHGGAHEVHSIVGILAQVQQSAGRRLGRPGRTAAHAAAPFASAGCVADVGLVDFGIRRVEVAAGSARPQWPGSLRRRRWRRGPGRWRREAEVPGELHLGPHRVLGQHQEHDLLRAAARVAKPVRLLTARVILRQGQSDAVELQQEDLEVHAHEGRAHDLPHEPGQHRRLAALVVLLEDLPEACEVQLHEGLQPHDLLAELVQPLPQGLAVPLARCPRRVLLQARQLGAQPVLLQGGKLADPPKLGLQDVVEFGLRRHLGVRTQAQE
mmetsp:Transcript_37800/g.117496  ORF Transcript_37800/g.117496 Transcript_37800/m.117496 type:complete len:464 (+) Transcript_37800:673-2064(+)